MTQAFPNTPHYSLSSLQFVEVPLAPPPPPSRGLWRFSLGLRKGALWFRVAGFGALG